MIVGSVLPATLRRQAEVKGAHRTAGPDHVSGSSDPMYPKPLDARLSGSLRLQRAKCITQPYSHHIDCSVQDRWFPNGNMSELDNDPSTPKGRPPERSEGEWVRLERWDRPTVVLTGFSAT